MSVMLPLDVVANDGYIAQPEQLLLDLRQLKSAGVYGVMGDVWWGLVEQSPGEYDWSSYLTLAKLIRLAGLKWYHNLSICKY